MVRERLARRAMTAAVAVVLVGAAVAAAPAADASSASLSAATAAAADAPTSAMTTVMEGLEAGTTEGVTTALVGWGLGAIDLNNAQDREFAEISSQLSEISDQLTAIESELETLASDITQQTCALETFDTTTAARAQIDTLTDTLQQFEAAGATTTQLDQFVVDVLSGTSSIQTEMNVINDALLNAGTADGIIASCLDTISTPAAGSGGDTTYYDLVANLTMYFYGYQLKGLNLLAEAYHYEAMGSWLKENPASSASVDEVAAICTGAAGDVGVYCADADYWTNQTYDDLQDQFAFAGAPYSVAGESVTLNGTHYVFVSSLEGFTSTQGGTCSTPLTSADPCGPASGTQLLTSFSQPNTFGNRTNWVPATPEAWQSILQWWTTSDETLGAYLAGVGFANTDVTKVVLTNTTYSAQPSEYINGVWGPVFTATAACFVDTSLTRSFSAQPFCYNGSSGGATYGDSFTLVSDNGYYNNDTCAYVQPPSSLPTDASNSYFYVGRYNIPAKGCESGWENGTTPGWIVQDAGYTEVQYLWPMFDMSAATCTTNRDGSSRSTTNPSGVYTMCGSDFDTWFSAIVPTPTATTPTAALSATTVPVGGRITLKTAGWRAGAPLSVALHSDPVTLDVDTSDISGSLANDYTVPLDTPLGDHAITIDGTTMAGVPYRVQVDLRVVPAVATPVRATPAFTG